MKSFYLLLSTLSIVSANFCDTNVDANGVVTWSGTSIPSNAFYGCDKIKSGVLTGVTSIGGYAFQNAGHVDGMDLTFDALQTIIKVLHF